MFNASQNNTTSSYGEDTTSHTVQNAIQNSNNETFRISNNNFAQTNMDYSLSKSDNTLAIIATIASIASIIFMILAVIGTRCLITRRNANRTANITQRENSQSSGNPPDSIPLSQIHTQDNHTLEPMTGSACTTFRS